MNIAFFGDSLTTGVPGVSFFQLIRERLQDDNLFNYGKGGDTVISLYHRVRKLSVEKLDIAFLWIGVNDVLVRVSPGYPLLKLLRRQPWATHPDAFIRWYEKLVNLLEKQSSLVLAVPPLFIGEDVDNRWNRQLETLGFRIKDFCRGRNKTRHVDLRRTFLRKLGDKSVSPHIKKNAAAMVKSALFPFSMKAGSPLESGLHYTVDGIHLNKNGAELVADCFLDEIGRSSASALFVERDGGKISVEKKHSNP